MNSHSSCHSCHSSSHHGQQENYTVLFILSAILTFPLLLQMVFEWVNYPVFLPSWLQLLLATLVQFRCGWPFLKGALSSLRTEPDMNLLVSLGTLAAFGYSAFAYFFSSNPHFYFETSTMIITLVLAGRMIENFCQKKAASAIESLLKLQPKTAKILRNGEFVDVPISEIIIGDFFLVRPGENIPVDGIVEEGSSSVNEAMLTGESLPVLKSLHAPIFAATTNLDGILKGKATKIGKDTVLSRIIQLVSTAQNSKPPIQKIADKISAVFVPSVLFISFLTFAIGWIITRHPLPSLTNAVAVLIVACPCALGIAIPIVILVASGLGARHGILFRDAIALEKAHEIEKMIFDKTGTLTEGKPVLSRVVPEGLEFNPLIQLSASLANTSAHPLSQAIVAYAKSHSISLLEVAKGEAMPGKGISGEINNRKYFLGSPLYAKEMGFPLPEYSNKEEIKTISLFWEDKKILGIFFFEDLIRPEAFSVIRALKEKGIKPIMITGDQFSTAKKIADQIGIQEFYSQVLPEKKAEFVIKSKEKKEVIGMIGDGINDAPALALADVGFAMGFGSDIAIETAPITLIRNDLNSVIDTINLSKNTSRKIKQNLFFAFFYNVLGIPLAALGFLNPIIAAAAMALSSISVIINALLLQIRTKKANSDDNH